MKRSVFTVCCSLAFGGRTVLNVPWQALSTHLDQSSPCALHTLSCPLGATGILLTALTQSQLFLQVLEARGLTASIQERIKGAMPGMLTVIS